jgi:hypothetical protein
MLLYAVDEFTCWRKILLAYFGEFINDEMCNKKCDNCFMTWN